MTDLWALEERFWLDDITQYETYMHPRARMVFPSPVGILDAQGVLESLKQAPRWDTVTFHEPHIAHHGDTAILTYQGEGQRGEAEPYQALCSSTYLFEDGSWRLICHHQTPDTP